MKRLEAFERIYLGEKREMPKIGSRIDKFWAAIVNGEKTLPLKPSTRIEGYLAHMIDSSVPVCEPTTQLEKMWHAICTGEKLDGSDCPCCNDRYLRYIYEQRSGVNMLVPNMKPNKDGISYIGRDILLDGDISGLTKMQEYRNLLVNVGDTVTIRYKYKGGTVSGDGTASFNPSYILESNHAWAVDDRLSISAADYQTDKAVVTTLTAVPVAFLFGIDPNVLSFNNFKCEISFEKGDTTK